MLCNFRSHSCFRWQRRGACHCCEFTTNWIALTQDECDYAEGLPQDYLVGHTPILDATGISIGTRVQCKWNPAVKDTCCFWRPLDCRLYPFSPARLLDANGNVQIELWIGEKCPLYQYEPSALLEFVPNFVDTVLHMRADVLKTYDTWFRTVTPQLEGYVPFITWR